MESLALITIMVSGIVIVATKVSQSPEPKFIVILWELKRAMAWG
jgi:hypothetical protein